MKPETKKALRSTGLLLGLAALGAVVLLPFALFGLLGAFPLYVTYGGLFLGVTALIACFLWKCGYVPRRLHRWLGWGMLCVLLIAAGYIGHGFWRDSLSTVNDRGLLLAQYDPFRADTKAAKLDTDATLRLAPEQLLRLDGATALYPVYAAFVRATYPEDYFANNEKGIYEMVECTNTVNAYTRLIEGETDLIFCAAPSKAQLEAAEQAGVALHMTPIGREAFVFFVNSKNPVTGLSVEQIQGIYSGTITNWKQVGGKNRTIRPFQRAENSGSQSALQALMQGLPLLEPEEEERIGAMDGIIREVASYRNYSNAIGFSYRFYATEMVQSGDIRLLSVNGVSPTKETIRDESYPIASAFYAIAAAPIGMPHPRETDPDMDALLNWIVSEQGQTLVERTGYVALD